MYNNSQVAVQLELFDNPIPQGYEKDRGKAKVTPSEIKEFQTQYCRFCEFEKEQDKVIRTFEKILEENLSFDDLFNQDEIEINPVLFSYKLFRITRTNITDNNSVHSLTGDKIESISLPHCRKYVDF